MTADFFQWIEAHKEDDVSRLRLKYGRERADEILQIECRRKYASKLGDVLHRDPEFIFPTALSGEQATSCRLAHFHASMVKPGDKVVDLTSGLGIDVMAMAHRVGEMGHVIAVERDENVADALRHNARDISNIEVITSDCRTLVDVWAQEGMKFDWVFIDPARRAADGGRVFALDQCEPNVVAMLPVLSKISKKLIIKASPMLDISHTVGLLPQAEKVITLGSTTECKELDVICDFARAEGRAPEIEAVTLGDGLDSRFEFTRLQEAEAKPDFGLPTVGGYVYDPYPAVMKAAPFNLLSQRFGLKKLAANTQLWCSETLVEKFPGRAYRVLEILPYMSKHIKRYASRYPKIGVTARNFDISSDALRAKLAVKDGPMQLFAVTAFNSQKLLITTEPIQ